MSVCGGVSPTKGISEKKGRGEALAAYCLQELISRCLGEEGGVVEEYLLRSSKSVTVGSVDILCVANV